MYAIDMTPWARAALTDADIAYIQAEAPNGSKIQLGKGKRGWTCRVSFQGVVIGEAYHVGTPMAAFRSALADVVAKEAARA